MLSKANEILKKYYGYSTFREGQDQIIESLLQGDDVLGIMPTGGGKSLCFQIPALMMEGTTLVFSPLISLMKDQVDGLESIGIPTTFINSSLDYKALQQRIYKAAKGEYKLLYIAPERLESEQFRELLLSLKIAMIVIDEAHCISQWGHDFRPSYMSIATFVKAFKEKPIVSAFTATATQVVTQDIIKNLSITDAKVYITGFDRQNLSFSVLKGENKRDFITDYIRDNQGDAGIIYAATRKEVDALYTFLKKKGCKVGRYHAGMTDEERIKNQEDFLYDNINIVVATNAFGMGIDKSNVRYVIHYNMPKNMEAYYQEAGRAGRDGEPSECILLFSAQDILIQKFLIEQTLLSPDRKSNEYKKLQTMVDYCYTPRCLRQQILSYFGDTGAAENCGNCSNCNDDSEAADITVDAQKIFSTVRRMRENYGVNLVADVLKGAKNKKVMQFGFDKLTTYGLMSDYKSKDIVALINLLVSEGYMMITEGGYPLLKLQLKSLGVLKGEERVIQKIKKKKQKAAVDTTLFDALRHLRKQIAEEERVPPYVIFHDSTISEMSRVCPTSEAALLSIGGVGERKLKKYGERFISEIKQYCEAKGIIIEHKPDINTEIIEIEKSAQKKKDKDTPSHVLSIEMYNTGKSIAEIAKARNMKPLTIQDHIIRCASEGHDIDWTCIIPSDYEQLIVEKVKELGAEKLKPIKEALPEAVDYMAIKAVICKLQLCKEIG